MADRPGMFGPTRGLSGMADSMETCKMLWADPCCHGNEIWARHGDPTGLFIITVRQDKCLCLCCGIHVCWRLCSTGQGFGGTQQAKKPNQTGFGGGFGKPKPLMSSQQMRPSGPRMPGFRPSMMAAMRG